uniref:Uncharacterized protein n=1 Tax=mine drainage metagenome TaxID=410659 RepID=E6QMZ4_9ZZZZ
MDGIMVRLLFPLVRQLERSETSASRRSLMAWLNSLGLVPISRLAVFIWQVHLPLILGDTIPLGR